MEVNKLESTLQGLDPEFALSVLTPRHQEILRMRFGINGEEPQKQTQIAKEFDVTRQRIHLLEKRILGRLATLRELYRPEKAFYLERDTLSSDGGYRWSVYPNPAKHKTWENTVQ